MVLSHETDAAIQRATIRATARNIQATPVDTVAVGYDRTVYYACGAFSHAGCHRVALSYTADGVTAVCDCEAGQSGRVCHHIAAALMAEEMPHEEPAPINDTVDEIEALSDRLQRYWTTEVGNWAEYDALHVKLRELRQQRDRTQARSAEPWKDPNFISNLLTPPAGF